MDTYESDSDIEDNEINIEEDYINKFLFFKTFQEELEVFKTKYSNSIIYYIISNNLKELTSTNFHLDYSDLIFFNKNNNKKRNYVWYGLYMNMRYVNTIYYLLLKLISINYHLRVRCKCCMLKKCDITKNEEELSIMINNILTSIGTLQCSCKYDNKFNYLYKEDYYNTKQNYNILTKYLPNIISLLKNIYKIRTNIEELYLTKPTRCIHDDIRNRNIVYCIDQRYHKINNNHIIRIISIIELVYNEYIKNIEIIKILFSKQTTEAFENIIDNQFNNNELINILQILFRKSNDFIILDHDKIIQVLTNINNINMGKIIIKYFCDYLSFDDVINYIIAFLLKDGNKFYEYIYLLSQYDNINYSNNKIKINNNVIHILFDALLDSNIHFNKKGKLFNIYYTKGIYDEKYNLIYKLSSILDGDDIFNNISDNSSIKNIDNIDDSIYNCIANMNHSILSYIFKKYTHNSNPFEYYIDIVDSILEYKYKNILEILFEYKKFIKNDILINAINNNLFILVDKIINDTNIIYNDILNDCIKKDNYISFKTIINKYPKLVKINKIVDNIFESKYVKIFIYLLLDNNELHDIIYVYTDNIPPLWYYILFKMNKNTKIGFFKKMLTFINPTEKYNDIPIILYTYLEDEYEITLELFNNLISKNSIYKYKTDATIYDFFIDDDINYIPIIVKYLKNVPTNFNYNIDDFNNMDLPIDNLIIYMIIVINFIILFEIVFKISYIENDFDMSINEENCYQEYSTNDKTYFINTIENTIEDYNDRKIIKINEELDDSDIFFK